METFALAYPIFTNSDHYKRKKRTHNIKKHK